MFTIQGTPFMYLKILTTFQIFMTNTYIIDSLLNSIARVLNFKQQVYVPVVTM